MASLHTIRALLARGPARFDSCAFALAAVLASACGEAEPADEELTQEAGAVVNVPSATDAGTNTNAADAGQQGTNDTGGSNGTGGSLDAGRPDAGGASTRDAATQPPAMGTTDAGRTQDAGASRDAGPARDAAAPATPDGGRIPMGRKFVGNITTRGQVRSDFITYWNQITPENEGKWGSVEGTRDRMNWAGLDAAYQYAKMHGIPFKQHTFVWGSQQPNWIASLPAAEQREEVEEWIRLYCERYPDTQLIDVVNEPPPHTTPPYMNAIGGAGASGYDWIVQSFKWARQYCPNAILILNDYNNIEYGDQNTHFIDIAKAIKAAGAPIDAVGAQAHDAFKLSTSSVQQMIDKLATSTGLPVYISEYDIDQANDMQQQQVMQSQFTMFWNNPNVKGITIWGYIVGATWRPNTGLMNANGGKRPAMTWLEDFLKGQAP